MKSLDVGDLRRTEGGGLLARSTIATLNSARHKYWNARLFHLFSLYTEDNLV